MLIAKQPSSHSRKKDTGIFTPDLTATELYQQLTTVEAAAFLNIPKRNLEYMRQTGKGPLFVRVSPRNIRYRIIDLIRFQECQLRLSTISDKAVRDE